MTQAQYLGNQIAQLAVALSQALAQRDELAAQLQASKQPPVATFPRKTRGPKPKLDEAAASA